MIDEAMAVVGVDEDKQFWPKNKTEMDINGESFIPKWVRYMTADPCL